MVLDTSAILALLFREPSRDDLLRKIGEAGSIAVGAPTLGECAIVLAARMGDAGPQHLGRLLERAGAVVIAFEAVHWQVAADAWLRFGRGRHPARLNLGDCLSYATSRVAGQPLLCTGNDFPQTDLALA